MTSDYWAERLRGEAVSVRGRSASTRRLVEMAYLHAWGPEGDWKMRDKFRKHFARLRPEIGDFTWDAYRFRWTKP